MRILIDADGCPVVTIVQKIAEKRQIPLILFCDTSHLLQSDYAQIRMIDKGADAVDFALTAECRRGDVFVTQDYGLAGMLLTKGAYGLNQNGMQYTNENMDGLLMQRHLARKARMSKTRQHIKGPARRTKENDEQFVRAFERLLDERLTKDGQ